jgi:hypothetical protein
VKKGENTMQSNTIQGIRETPPHEGELTKKIEETTSKIPSVGFLSVAIGSMFLSATLLFASDRKEYANFVGLWVPSLLLMGIYNKLVKLEGGSDFSEKRAA